MRVAVDAVERNWQRPDAGLWEPEDRWWTHSRLGVACGLRHIADVFPDPAARRRTTLSDTIMAETRRRCLRADSRWRRAADDGAEAALLVPLARGCPSPEDPSNAATRAYIEDELAEDGYVYRFNHPGGPLGREEGVLSWT